MSGGHTEGKRRKCVAEEIELVDKHSEISDGKSSHSRVTKWYSISTDMVSPKATYFFENAKRSCITPYMMLFLTSVGLDPTRAGLVNGIRYIGYIIGLPFWGMIADRTKAHRLIVFLICIFAILFSCSQPLVTLFIGNDQINHCPVNVMENGTALSNINHLSGFDVDPLFYTLMTLCLFTNFFDGSTLAFADAGVMQKISVCTKKHDYGQQRLFGAFGFACGSLFSSGAIEIFPNIAITCYSAAFIIYFVMVVAFVISSNKLYKGLSFENTNESNENEKLQCERKENENLRSQLWATLKQFDAIVLLMSVLLVGIIRGLYISFLFLYLKELKATNVTMGISIAIGAISSICVHFYSSYIIKQIGGTYEAICLSCFAWAVRFFVITYLTKGWHVLLLQMINGLCVALFISAVVRHVKNISKSTVLASMYGITNSLYTGCGMILANVIGGVMYEKYGSQKLNLIAAFSSVIWGVMLMVFIFITRCTGKNTENNEIIISPSEI